MRALPLLLVACGPAALPVTEPAPVTTTTFAITDPVTTPLPGTTGAPRPLELCVNEFMPANIVAAADETGAHPDWIELHNPSAYDLPLDGWTLTDDPADPEKHRLARGLVLEAGAWLVLWADGLPELGPTHLGFSLSEAGEAVGVFAPDGSGSVVRFGEVPGDLAVARTSDCCVDDGCFDYVFAGSPGSANAP